MRGIVEVKFTNGETEIYEVDDSSEVITVWDTGMTNRQEQVLRLRAIEGYSVADLEHVINLSKATISEHFKLAALKLLKVYQRWEGMND